MKCCRENLSKNIFPGPLLKEKRARKKIYLDILSIIVQAPPKKYR